MSKCYSPQGPETETLGEHFTRVLNFVLPRRRGVPVFQRTTEMVITTIYSAKLLK